MRSLLFLLALVSACSVVNREHCGNQDGDATCIARDPSRPHCSICVAENDGCLAQAPADGCAAASTGVSSTGPLASSTTGEPTTSTSTTTSTSAASSTSTTDATSSASSTSTGDNSTTTTTTGTDTDPDTTDTTAGPMCGNGVLEGEEVCDGKDLGDKTCAELLPDKWGGGMLACNDCSSFNDSECCIGVGQKCDPFMPDEPCCGGLECTMDALPSVESHCQNP